MSETGSSRGREATGEFLARRVRDAVDAAERRICGDAAVGSAAVAEGLAWAGRRTARLLGAGRDETPASGAIDAPWVDHRVRRARSVPPDAYAFELIAGDGQQAVDHCLVAHRLAAALGRPGLCTIDAGLADTVELVHLPRQEWIASLPEIGPASREQVTDARVIETARAVFAEVSGQTGRPLEPAAALEPDDARFVLVAVGSAAALTERIVAKLRAQGIPCGALLPTLLRPFPVAQFRERLAAAEAVAVLSDGVAGVAGMLARRIEAMLGPGTRVGAVDVSPDGTERLGEGLERLLGQELPALPAAEGARDGAAFAIAGLPGSGRVEELLLDSVAWLGRLAEPRLDCRREAAAASVVVTVGPRHREDRQLDLLVAMRPEALTGVEPLERLRECGTLLLAAGTEEPATAWARLTPEQRAMIVRRRLGLRLLVPEIRDPFALQVAVLAAADGIGSALGWQGAILEALAAAPLSDAERTALSVGSRGLVTVEPARLPEPDDTPPAARPVPRMPAIEQEPDPDRWRAELRRFHFDRPGAGIEWGRSLTGALRPAVLDAQVAEDVGRPAEPLRSPFDSWSRVVLADRRRRRAELVDEVIGLEERLREMLGLPAEPGAGDSAEGLAARLGEVGAEFVDAAVLEERLAERRRPATPTGERETRLNDALDRLQRFRERGSAEPLAYVILSETDRVVAPPADVELLRHEDGLRAAVGLFDGLAPDAVAFARALRTARLEVGGNFDEKRHGPALARLDWKSLTTEELFGMPVVVVLETARHLRGPALAAFSELLRSGRPLHVLVEESIADPGPERTETTAGYHPGLGYLAVAHREALVVQSSIGSPQHLASALGRAVEARDPTVIITAMPSGELPFAGREQLRAAVEGRATPCFVYDPAGGATWAERFALDDNPQPERAWPIHAVAYEDGAGERQSMDQPFTFAHAAALDPAWRAHFRVVGPEGWLDDQVEITEYLELTDRERGRCIPYLWVVEDDELARALIGWELAFACRDRARAWRILQELAGTDNAYARRAAEEARQEALEESEKKTEKLEADFAIALEAARSQGAAAAVERLVTMLADPRGLQAALAAAEQAPSTGAIPPVTAAALQEAAASAAAPAAAPEAAAPIGKPYIDSFLCTTCNDCTNMNPRMFRYNENKQAEIADPTQGTFKELVKAAEACPARCIHPGAPREGDKTATPALVKRAAKFN
jgi:ferredoxin